MSDAFRPPYRVSEASRRLGISDYQTRQAVKRGDLDGFRLGHTLLIRPGSVDRLLRGDSETLAAGDDAA
jgi:excisionase family DNA binding protein